MGCTALCVEEQSRQAYGGAIENEAEVFGISLCGLTAFSKTVIPLSNPNVKKKKYSTSSNKKSVNYMGEYNKYGYRMSSFPLSWNDHKIVLHSNRAYESSKGYYVHLDIHCVFCQCNSVVRFRVSVDSFDEDELFSLAKIICLQPFSDDCGKMSNDEEYRIP